jgi:hypothetical protein
MFAAAWKPALRPGRCLTFADFVFIVPTDTLKINIHP